MKEKRTFFSANKQRICIKAFLFYCEGVLYFLFARKIFNSIHIFVGEYFLKQYEFIFLCSTLTNIILLIIFVNVSFKFELHISDLSTIMKTFFNFVYENKTNVDIDLKRK